MTDCCHMDTSGLLVLVGAVALCLPGVAWFEFGRCHHPLRGDSRFVETARVALAAGIAHSTSLCIIGVAAHFLGDRKTLIAVAAGAPMQAHPEVFEYLVAESILALALASASGIARRWHIERTSSPTRAEHRLWDGLLEHSPTQEIHGVVVNLTEPEGRLTGVVESFSNLDNSEVLLRVAVTTLHDQPAGDGTRVVLKVSPDSNATFNYIPAAEAAVWQGKTERRSADRSGEPHSADQRPGRIDLSKLSPDPTEAELPQA